MSRRIRTLIFWLAIGTVVGIDVFCQTSSQGSRVYRSIVGGLSVVIFGAILAPTLRNRFMSESLASTVVDARGKPIRVIHAESLAIGARELPPELRAEVLRAGLPHTFTRLSWPSLHILRPVIALTLPLAVAYGPDGTDRVAMVLVGTTGFLIFASARSRLHDAVAAVYLKHRRCPGCGYDLKTLLAADDGCTICPECGAAWRLDAQRDFDH